MALMLDPGVDKDRHVRIEFNNMPSGKYPPSPRSETNAFAV